MKIVFFLWPTIVCSANAFGQMVDTTITANVYAGILNQHEYSFDGESRRASVNVHAGAVAYWTMSPKLVYTSFGVIHIDQKEVTALQAQYLTYKPNKKWKLFGGFLPTLATEQRPFPVSSGGQFETWTQSRILGATFGIKTKHMLSEETTVGVGIAMRNRMAQYDVSFQYKEVTIAGYRNGSRQGIVATYDKGRMYALIVCNEAIVANTSVFKLVRKHSVYVWSDAGYDHKRSELVRYEGGLFKSFEIKKKVNGLFAVGYDAKTNCFTTYLFVHRLF